MTKYLEILRLKSLEFSERNVALSCGVSGNTVSKVLKKANEVNISCPPEFDMTDSILEKLSEAEARDVFELIHKCHKRSSTIFARSSVKKNGITRLSMVKIPLLMQ